MKLVILDRDGVINHDSDDYIKCADEWLPIEGSLEAVARLCRSDFTVVVATNQSGIGRGYYDVNTLHEIHVKMDNLLNEVGGRIEAVFFCPHTPEDQCDCRKPRDGLVQNIAERYKVSLSGVPLIGDSLTDLQAAISAGAKPMLVRTGKGLKTEKMLEKESIAEVPVFDNLSDAVNSLIAAQE